MSKKTTKKNVGKKPFIIAGACAGVAALGVALGKAFKSMKDSAKAQHEVDKANFDAVKAESKANWEEAKAMGRPETREAMMQAERDAQIAEAQKRKAEAESRIEAAKQK